MGRLTMFKEKTAKILVVETSLSARSAISDSLKALGFSDIQTMDSLKAALGYLEVETVHWVLSPLLIGES